VWRPDGMINDERILKYTTSTLFITNPTQNDPTIRPAIAVTSGCSLPHLGRGLISVLRLRPVFINRGFNKASFIRVLLSCQSMLLDLC
jgi:hypothetical protein